MVFQGYVLKVTDNDTSYPALAVIPSHSDVKTSGVLRVRFSMRVTSDQIVEGNTAGLFIGRDNPFDYSAGRILLFVGMSRRSTVNPDYPDNIVLIVYDDSGTRTVYDTGVAYGTDPHDIEVVVNLDNSTVDVYVDGELRISSVALKGTIQAGQLVLTVGYGSGTGNYAYFDDIHVIYNDTEIYAEDFEDQTTDITAWDDCNTQIEIVRSEILTVPVITPSQSPVVVTPDGSNRTFMTTIYDMSNDRYVHFYGYHGVTPAETRKAISTDGLSPDIANETTVVSDGSVPVVIRVGDYWFLFVRHEPDHDRIDIYKSRDLVTWEKVGSFNDPELPDIDPWGVVYDKMNSMWYLYYNSVSPVNGRRVTKIATSRDLQSWEVKGFIGFQDDRDKYCVYVYPARNGYWYALVMDREGGASDNGVVRIYRADNPYFNNAELLAIIDTNSWHGGVDSDTPSINWHNRYLYVARQNADGLWNEVAVSLDSLNQDLQNSGVDPLPDPDTNRYDVVGSVTIVGVSQAPSMLPMLSRLLALLIISSLITGKEVRIERYVEMFVRLIIYEKLISVLGEMSSGGG